MTRLTNVAVVIFFLGIIGLGYMHEQVHVEIYRGYGVESHVEYFSHFPNLVTIAKEPCPVEECVLAHNINEIASYPLLIFYVVFGQLALMVLVFLENKSKEENKKWDFG